ncbi:GNAT family N-acetyltransferase [Actinokineospora globicatena]|uniref:GNAT family N-acetyltransferase n=1 Tax=Actinokineospora globicatena TaxID=103729 RepID=UPI0020A53DF9|nr:GNAT family N-acetyltransferase [Actinokineospora globicatena]GLW76694.1 acetyltransferase [Actinokineospora globicatena]GLW83527.1 acetyltransferase [Actinokineospora globicatena]
MRVRTLSTTDVRPCLELAADREWPYEDRKWEFLLDTGQGYGIVDEGDNLVASTILTTSGDVAAISMVLVAARHARQGLGTRLVSHVLAEAGDATVHLHATSLGRPLYERLGFRSLAEVDAYSGTLDAGPSGRTRTAGGGDLAAILTLDTAVFGVDRSNVLSGLFDFADHVRVVERNGDLVGYAASWRPGTDLDSTIVGPVIATNPADARALIADLAADVGGAIRVDVDDQHPELASWLAERGLAPAFRCDLMTLGGRPLPGDRLGVHAPFMQALG